MQIRSAQASLNIALENVQIVAIVQRVEWRNWIGSVNLALTSPGDA